MPLQFKIFAGNSGYFDKSAPDVVPLFEQLDAITGGDHRGRARDARVLAALKKLAKEYPDFFPAYFKIASHHLGRDNLQAGLEAARRGLAAAHRLLPESFDGLIEWRHPENHEYLGLIIFAMMICTQLDRHDEAVEMGLLCLSRNPEDSQATAYVLGSEALRAGKVALARDICTRYADRYPMLHYELALSYILEKDWVPAATAMRRGFAGNPYFQMAFNQINEISGRVMHHHSKFQQPQAADYHRSLYGELWANNIDALLFMDWLYDHPNVTAERACILACRDSMLWADGGDMDALVRRERELVDAIDDRLSMQIVRERTLRDGISIWPWRYEDYTDGDE